MNKEDRMSFIVLTFKTLGSLKIFETYKTWPLMQDGSPGAPRRSHDSGQEPELAKSCLAYCI